MQVGSPSGFDQRARVFSLRQTAVTTNLGLLGDVIERGFAVEDAGRLFVDFPLDVGQASGQYMIRVPWHAGEIIESLPLSIRAYLK